MPQELLFSEHVTWDGICCLVRVYRTGNTRCPYRAESRFSVDDRIISDGLSTEEALQRHMEILPAALLSRRLVEKS